jgi:5-methylcytosine-specific restriction endonuclease McrA
MSTCLALNASYEPLTLMSFKRAMRLVYQGKAEVVESDGRTAKSERTEYPWPLVIRLVAFVEVPRRFRKRVTNTFLFARDRYTCQYCGRHDRELKHRESLTRDHIVPQSRGGGDSWRNCVTACSSCNWKKANKTPAEAGLRLRSTPTEPNFVELKWTVRSLTPTQRKFITLFYGSEAVAALEP